MENTKVSNSNDIDFSTYKKISDFVLREARLCDESRYVEWESLWTEDGHYWVPRAEGMDPESQMSHINDNRSRIATRIKQYMTGRKQSQTPPSILRRVLSGIEIEGADGQGYSVGTNFIVSEMAIQSLPQVRYWAGRASYFLRDINGTLFMARKKVVLINGDEPIPNLAFLI